jgi:hypothetical protein
MKGSPWSFSLGVGHEANNLTSYNNVLKKLVWDGMDWIDLAQDRDQWRALVNMVMNLRVPQNAGKILSSCTFGSFSRRTQLRK